jgi:hypothetical protein
MMLLTQLCIASSTATLLLVSGAVHLSGDSASSLALAAGLLYSASRPCLALGCHSLQHTYAHAQLGCGQTERRALLVSSADAVILRCLSADAAVGICCTACYCTAH